MYNIFLIVITIKIQFIVKTTLDFIEAIIYREDTVFSFVYKLVHTLHFCRYFEYFNTVVHHYKE